MQPLHSAAVSSPCRLDTASRSPGTRFKTNGGGSSARVTSCGQTPEARGWPRRMELSSGSPSRSCATVIGCSLNSVPPQGYKARASAGNFSGWPSHTEIRPAQGRSSARATEGHGAVHLVRVHPAPCARRLGHDAPRLHQPTTGGAPARGRSGGSARTGPGRRRRSGGEGLITFCRHRGDAESCGTRLLLHEDQAYAVAMDDRIVTIGGRQERPGGRVPRAMRLIHRPARSSRSTG